MNTWLAWGVPVVTWFQGLGSWLTPPMRFFALLGNEEFYLLVMPALLWCYDMRLGFRVGLVFLSSASLNSILKLGFHWPRPYWVTDSVQALSAETSFGFPSGHAQNAVVVWGRLALGLARRWAYVALALLILAISLSRIYLAVHFPSDVLGGWLFGALWLLLILRLEEPLRRRLRQWSSTSVVLLCLAGALLFILVGWSAASLAPPVPEEWEQIAARAAPQADPIDPLSLRGLVANAGALFGLAAGGQYLFRWGGFSAGGVWWKRLLRYLLGVVGVVLIYYGLRLVFPPASMILRFLRYAAVGFWVVYLGPRLFAALKLAQAED